MAYPPHSYALLNTVAEEHRSRMQQESSASVFSLLEVHRETFCPISCLRRPRIYSFIFGLVVLFLIMASYVLSSEGKAFLITSSPYHSVKHGTLLFNLSSDKDSAHISQVLHRILSNLAFRPRKLPDLGMLVRSETHMFSVIPRHFLPDVKNPCWYEQLAGNGSVNPYQRNLYALYSRQSRVAFHILKKNFWKHLFRRDGKLYRIRCLPYFYIIGQPKCGTTDLYERLRLHPGIRVSTLKEPHWWTRKRFGIIRPSDGLHARYPVEDYLDLFDLPAHHVQYQMLANRTAGSHRADLIIGEASASTMWDNNAWSYLYGNTSEAEPPFLIQDFIHALQPEARFIAILRDPVERAPVEIGLLLVEEVEEGGECTDRERRGKETRWKGSKARSIGAGFKLFYYGVDSKRNGVGVVLKEEFVRNVLEVKRVSDRVMSLKLEIEGVMLNVVSGYAPQVGCELEEKERFWSELDEVMESIPTGERVVIGADFNGHVGEGNRGDEEVMGKFGVKERNLEGQMVVDFAKRLDMAVVNTYFQKREEHRVTYKSGGRRTQVDYILCRRGNLKEISDCKVVVGESVARQHRMVMCRMTLMVCKKKRSKIEKKTKWWKLKKEECCEEFRQKLRQALGGQVVLPDDWETTAEVIRETGRKVLGVSSGRRKEDKETWWWNKEVQDSIQRKRLAKKKWNMDRTEENRQEYKELQRRVKREVSKAKQKAYDELYTRLDTREGEKDLYRLARQRDRDGKDVQQVRVIKDRDGRVLTSEESVQRRWKEYFEELMNEENEREKRVEGVNSVEQKVDKIRKDEVRKALKRMKSGKAVGPDDIPVEVWKCLGEAAVEFLTSLFNRVLESERMPEEWRRSVLVPIFKNKGDVQSCSNYRGIKLMSHIMKLWERVVEARLRKVVEICEQQYGFMPRKSTTDAIFALRILMEKYRDGQRELHCVFVDLEKAYDRVPREELWYCMRKSGVAEKYVRVVQDMYERSRTVVRCAVGQTEEFNVEVGLHQGSALSPFLFAIVMDQLSEEVRQESPWTMMFADDIVICSESREQVEENLERWRFALERRGMKVSRSKTEYMCVNEREGSGTVRLQGEEVKKVQEFKYLGSTVQSNGECGKEVKKRVQAGWNGWRKVWGVLCERKISARIKGKVYRTVVRAAMLYGLETVSLRKRQESELEVAELKMLRFSLGVTRLDRIRNEYIRGTAHVGRLGDKVREARLRWFGHVQRRESEYIGRRMLDMELPGRRQRGRPKRRLYSDYLYFGMANKSVEDFQEKVWESLQLFDACLQEFSLRACVYNSTLNNAMPVRLHVGVYVVYVLDWLSVFSRDQLLVLRLEDHAADKRASMNRVFRFLQLGSLSEQKEVEITERPASNTRRLADKNLGPMLPLTRRVLTHFYSPFNRKLASVLQDNAFLWEHHPTHT
ncbi:hypothetical protein QTP70_029773 [Hemibagrus guttatus]|uniref:ribonuclease H n=1 Tax=Hemibagrus guttatus TaxID=175788 RepID=A0AAE0V1H4_9TELE|nr:hypothetical protein QTP70_029773 [Hemibagrus guttatus]